jgi:hypothetical protein
VRRFILAIFVGAATLSTSLKAQTAWALGFAGTLGTGWQIEGGDLGIVHYLHVGPFRSALIGARVGTFINEGAIVGGTQGILGAAMVAVRTGILPLADIGNETNPSSIGLDLTIEADGYAGSEDPLPQPSPWVAIGIFPGVSFGGGDSPHYGIVLGPSVFLGRVTTVHGFLGLRFELPRSHHIGPS